jgi:hypothetical protein
MRVFIISLLLFGFIALTAVGGESKPVKGTLEIVAKLVEIPGGKFPDYPKNSVYYNHVAILKYKIVKIVKGTYPDSTIMVGQYMPTIPRDQIKDKMDSVVSGNVKQMKAGDLHRLILDKPISKHWDREEAVFDSYFDDEEGDRYFAIKTDMNK